MHSIFTYFLVLSSPGVTVDFRLDRDFVVSSEDAGVLNCNFLSAALRWLAKIVSRSISIKDNGTSADTKASARAQTAS